jgi:fluoride exporter
MTALLVAAAGAAGVLARYGLSRLPLGPAALPWTIVAVNVAGSFLLGLLVAEPAAADALGAGFLGGFTTFSTFSVQIVTDVDGGRPGRALAYLAVSVAGGIAAAAAGCALGRRLA